MLEDVMKRMETNLLAIEKAVADVDPTDLDALSRVHSAALFTANRVRGDLNMIKHTVAQIRSNINNLKSNPAACAHQFFCPTDEQQCDSECKSSHLCRKCGITRQQLRDMEKFIEKECD